MAKRRSIPKDLEAKILMRSARRCCLCFYLDDDVNEKLGQLAHLDRDGSNNSEDNLAFLCLHHHSVYDSHTNQHRLYTITEVKEARKRLYEDVSRRVAKDWVLVLDGKFDQHSKEKVEKIVEELRKVLDDPTLTIRKITPGSITVHLEGDSDAYKTFKELVETGGLTSIEGLRILNVENNHSAVQSPLVLDDVPHDPQHDHFTLVPLKLDIENALCCAEKEEDIHKFLAAHRGIVTECLGHPRKKPLSLVLSKFPLGSRHIPDLAVFAWDSNIFRIALIELEPVSDPVVTKAGRPSARLSSAMKQVADWKRWVEHGGSELVLELRRTLWEHAPEHLTEFFATHWIFSATRYEFAIFIGRSSTWSPVTTEHINSIRGLHDSAVRIYSYDRFLRYAKDS